MWGSENPGIFCEVYHQNPLEKNLLGASFITVLMGQLPGKPCVIGELFTSKLVCQMVIFIVNKLANPVIDNNEPR